MALKKEYIIGLLTIIILSTATYISLSDNVRLRVDNDKSTFYVKNDNNRWVISGREYNSMWDGTSKMNRRASQIVVHTFIDEENEKIKIERITPYIRGPVIIDTYLFDGRLDDVRLFPVEHNVQILNGSGYIYQYEVKELVYDGPTIKNIQSPQKFGRKMEVEWQDGNYYSKIYKYRTSDKGKLTIKYRVTEDDSNYKVRLFDPPVNTTVKHAEVTIADTIVDGNTYVLYSNSSFNATDQTQVIFTGGGQVNKQTGGSPSDLYTRIKFNNTIIYDRLTRIVTKAEDRGTAQIFPFNFTVPSGENYVSIEFREDGVNTLSIPLFELHAFKPESGQSNPLPFQVTSLNNATFSSLTPLNIFNFSLGKADNSSMYIDIVQEIKKPTSPEDTVTCFANNTNTGQQTLNWTQFLVSNTARGMTGMNIISDKNNLSEDWEIYCNSEMGETIDTNITVFMMDMADTLNNTVIFDQVSNESVVGLTAGENIMQSSLITPRTDSQLTGVATFVIQSTSGGQEGIFTPSFFVNISSGEVCGLYQRSTTQDKDIQTAKFYYACNVTKDVETNVSWWVNVTTGNTLNVRSFSSSIFETEQLNITAINIPPLVFIDQPLNDTPVGGPTLIKW